MKYNINANFTILLYFFNGDIKKIYITYMVHFIFLLDSAALGYQENACNWQTNT